MERRKLTGRLQEPSSSDPPSEPGSGYTVRPYQSEDEPQVLGLLATTLRGWAGEHRARLWRWKHHDSPFGPSKLFIAATDRGQVVGLQTLMPWQLRRHTRLVPSYRAADICTHPSYQRRGIATALSGLAKDDVIAFASVMFNTPNSNSARLTVKQKLSPIATMRASIEVVSFRRPLLGWLHSATSGPKGNVALPMATLLEHQDELEDLTSHDVAHAHGQFSTARSWEYLRWRYGSHPIWNYYAVCAWNKARLEGCVIFRVDDGPWPRVIVVDTLVRRIDQALFRQLRRSLKELGFACVQYFLPHGNRVRPLFGRLALRRRRGYNLNVVVIDPRLGTTPLQPSCWSLTLGDLQDI